MAIAHPDKLRAFRIAGVDLGLSAPEVFEGGSSVPIKVWYWKKGVDPTVQRSPRVIPKPVRLSFKLIGPEALNNALFLDDLKRETDAVPFVWGDIAFEAHVKEVEYSAKQDGVDVALMAVPITDPNPNRRRLSTTTDFAPLDLLGEIGDSLADMKAFIDQVGAFADQALTTVRDALSQAETAVTDVTAALGTVAKIVELPTTVAAEVRDALTASADNLTTAAVDVVAAVSGASFAPPEIVVAAATVADAYNNTAERFNYIAQMVVPPAETHTVVEGETLTSIAEAAGTTVDQVLAMNPDVARSGITPGGQIEVPNE
jgi:LysM repeat protein